MPRRPRKTGTATMPRRAATRSTPSPRCFCWPWLFGGLLIGLGIGVGLHVSQPPPAPVVVEPNVPGDPAPAPEDPPPPRFEFYDTLESPPAPKPAPTTPLPAPMPVDPPPASETPVAAEIPPGSLMLQVAAFQAMDDADGMKNQLLELGFPAMIHSQVVNGTLLHRVRIGPFANSADQEAMRQKLLANQLKAMAVRH